jgi:DNA (cytosine-5)-methyltransferase 1
MNELHLFAGAGGGILGGILLGHTTVCAVEIEPYCRKVLLQRQRDGILPKFPIWDDVCTFDGIPWRGKVDVICGGFPCQDISVAGKGAGITGERSGLWKEFARIISEIRPTYVFLENSPILTSRGLGVVLGDLAEMGYDAKWGVLGAFHAGAPHKRERIWILANPKHQGLSRNVFQYGVSPEESGSKHGFQFLGGCRVWDNWKDSPGMFRDCHGMAERTNRIRAAGNGQVPAVAALAWRTLSQ